MSLNDAPIKEVASGPSQADQLTKPSVPDPKSVLASPSGKDTPSGSTSEDAPIVSIKAEVVETKDEKTKVEDPKVGSKFAALSRKERQIVAKQEELKSGEAKLLEEKSKHDAYVTESSAKLTESLKKVQEFESLKKLNALKAMEALGFTYQQITDIMLNEGNPTPEMSIAQAKAEMEAKFEEYKQSQAKDSEAKTKESEEKAKKAAEEEKTKLHAAQEKRLSEFKGEIKSFIGSNSDAYELTNLNDPDGELVFSVIDAQYAKDQRILKIEEAAVLVENFYEGKLQENLATKKMKAKVSPPAPAEEAAAAPKESPEAISTPQATVNAPPTKTLTNGMTSTSTTPAARSEAERWKRAMAALGKSA